MPTGSTDIAPATTKLKLIIIFKKSNSRRSKISYLIKLWRLFAYHRYLHERVEYCFQIRIHDISFIDLSVTVLNSSRHDSKSEFWKSWTTSFHLFFSHIMWAGEINLKMTERRFVGNCKMKTDRFFLVLGMRDFRSMIYRKDIWVVDYKIDENKDDVLNQISVAGRNLKN